MADLQRAHALLPGDHPQPGAAGLVGGVTREMVESWCRLAWQVPLAALLTLAQFMSFLLLLAPPGAVAPAPRSLEVEVAEMPPSAVSPPPPEPRTRPRRLLSLSAVRERIRVEPPRFPDPSPLTSARQVAPPPEPASPPPAAVAKPVIESADASSSTPVAPPRPMALSGLVDKERAGRQASEPGAGAPGAARAPDATVSNPVAGVRGGTLGGGNAGARAIYQPQPEIPETLRHRSIEITAVARFRVAANGSAEVELTEPTADSDLNRAVLGALRKWRFFPATQDGKPVASTLDIRIPISVK